MKVGVVGAGGVGTACSFAMALRGSARHIVRVNRTPERARGTVADLQHATVLGPPVSLQAGDEERGEDGASGRSGDPGGTHGQPPVVSCCILGRVS